MSAGDHLSATQFGSANDDPHLSTLMRGRTITEEDIPLDQVVGGVKINRAKARRYAAMATPLPPVVGVHYPPHGFVLYEGNHRAEAARIRGDSSIRGYVGR